jgi:hypothetical protein
VTACVLCVAETPGPLPYGLDEGWAVLKDVYGTLRAVCPEHSEVVAWSSMRAISCVCTICDEGPASSRGR